MSKIGCGIELLYGYVNGEEYIISLTPEQISAFIMEHQFEETIITNAFDVTEITTVPGGSIMYCADQLFLMEKLIPILMPIQMGDVEPPKFVPIVDSDVVKDELNRLVDALDLSCHGCEGSVEKNDGNPCCKDFDNQQAKKQA